MDSTYFIEIRNEDYPSLIKESASFYDMPISGAEELSDGLKFYFDDKNYWEDARKQWPDKNTSHFSYGEIPFENWNKKWEEDYESISIGDFCHIRAPFHPLPDGEFSYNLCIQPQMSFGTGHHSTTSLMIQKMANIDFNSKSVLDYGTGTGILAILAHKMGASEVLGIDIEANALENSRENAELNSAAISHILGDLSSIAQNKYDIVLANVNKNTLISSCEALSAAIPKGGILLLSGFYEQDIPEMQSKYESMGFVLDQVMIKQNWSLLCLYKNS